MIIMDIIIIIIIMVVVNINNNYAYFIIISIICDYNNDIEKMKDRREILL